jgi:hypothetical protein
MTIARPERADDFAAWAQYHVAQADAIGREPAAPDLPTRIGQLQGEVDHRVEAMGYAELAAKQAGRQFAAEGSRGIDAGNQGASNSKKETVMADENVSRELKPAGQLSDREIVTESRDLHARFEVLQEQYRTAPADQRAEIRSELEPLVAREQEIRQEAQGRMSSETEISRDRVPEQQIGYSR